MPTYDYKCPACEAQDSVFQTIASYSKIPQRPHCAVHGEMERKLSVVPGSAVSNSLAGDRHYENMRATDGTDISSRSKHRAYMKANNLTTADDFQKTWSKKAEERQNFRSGAHQDTSLKQDIVQAIQTKTA
jgi:putative FmdB family regulatory protein